jgi:4-hydroxy-tetrahydrodipicolinate reductase
MGSAVIDAIFAKAEVFELVGAVDVLSNVPASKHIGSGVAISSRAADAAKNCDVIIDFSVASAVDSNLHCALELGKVFICGVTNISADTENAMYLASLNIPVFYSPNMSIGVAVLKQAVKMAAKTLRDFDVEIFEMHHKNKADAPSGTALMLGKEIAAVRGADLLEPNCNGSGGVAPVPRPKDKIGFSAIRAGSCAGTHTVFFMGQDESVEMTHRSNSRGIFAAGTLMVTQLVYNKKKAGFYTMDNIMAEI